MSAQQTESNMNQATQSLFADHAYLPEGWRRNVLLQWDAQGKLLAVTPDAQAPAGVEKARGPLLPGMPNLHSHAFQRAMAGLTEYRANAVDSFWSWRDLMYRFAARITPEGLASIAQWLYIEMLKMMYELLNKARRAGMLAIEPDIENPGESPIFNPYPAFLKDRHARDFVCDTMRMAVTGGIDPFDMDQMMELDIEVQHRSADEPVHSLSNLADSLPGLGIVAAVLGVVITMGALGGPPEEIGHKVAAALVGTFLGILMCYGLIGPVSASMGKAIAEEGAYLYMLRVLMLSFIKGNPPVMAIEMGRRAIPPHVRPSFEEVEAACRHPKAAEETESAA